MKKPLKSFLSKAPCNLCFALCLCLTAIFGISCGSDSSRDEGNPVLSHGGNTLYEREVAYFLPDSLNAEDSVRLTQQYLDEWLQGQVVKTEAQRVIPDLEERIDYLLRAYERSIIEHEYVQWLTQEEPNGLNVSEAEILTYYQENPGKFQSNETYYQYFYVETKLSGQYKVVNLIRSDDPERIQELLVWCQENATEYKLDSSYVNDAGIERISPGFYHGPIRKAALNTAFAYGHKEGGEQFWDFFYLISVIKEGEMLPLSMCRDRILRTLRNQRKKDFIERHLSGLVQQAKAAQK